jgi:hypothetical protein
MTELLLGDFGLVAMGGNVGKGVRAGERLLRLLEDRKVPEGATRYGHAFIYVGDGMIVEARPGGARKTPNPYLHRPELLWSSGWFPDLTDTMRSKIVLHANMLAELRTPYSDLDYLAITAHALHIPAPGLRSYIETSKHMICSQAVDWCYEPYRLFKDDRWDGFVTPMDLAGLKP